MDAAIAAIDARLDASPANTRRVVVVGGGAGGCEVAMALAARIRGRDNSITVCDEATRPVAERGRRTDGL